MALIQSFVDPSKYSIKCPHSMSPIGVCVHNTANDAPAKNEASYMKSNNNQVSFHVAVDDVEAIQVIPFNRNAWAAGDGNGNGNRKYIHVEICYSKSGGTKFINAEKRAAKEIAAILKSYGWGIDKVKKHQDFSGKYCPHRTLDTGWQRFINMIKSELSGSSSNNISNSNPSNSNSFKVGDKVVVSKNATTYATGQAMASFVKGSTYTIQELKSDRALLKEITSWVYLKDLSKPSSSSSSSSQPQSCDKEIKRYKENGKCTITASAIIFRDKPCTCHGVKQGTYDRKQSVNYDLVVITEKYTWISWIGASSGKRRYMPIVDRKKNERWGTCV